MEFKFCEIDVEKSSTDELIKEIDRLKNLHGSYNNEQQALKIFLNSTYGAMANEYFNCFDVDLAEAVTLQGQDVNFGYIVPKIENYFKNEFSKDKELLEKLNFTNFDIELLQPIAVYGDTDSIFLNFSEIIKELKIVGNELDFIIKLYTYRFRDLLTKWFDEYSEKTNTVNVQDFELEKIIRTFIISAKKKYILDLAWKEPNISYDFGKKIDIKGIEIVRKSTPKFSRTVLMEAVLMILKEKKKLDYLKLNTYLKNKKEEFKLENVDNICFNVGVSDYNKGVISDRGRISLNSGCPVHVRASANYNYLLNGIPKLKQKYNLIKNKSKIKWYYSKSQKSDMSVFAFFPGEYPVELNPPEYDYDVMFQKTIINPLNSILKIIYQWEISNNLITINSLF